jgi:hypothetical protein
MAFAGVDAGPEPDIERAERCRQQLAEGSQDAGMACVDPWG